jgi:hypothetical protein
MAVSVVLTHQTKWCLPTTVLLCQCCWICINQSSNEIDGRLTIGSISAGSMKSRFGIYYVSHIDNQTINVVLGVTLGTGLWSVV